MTLRDDLTKYIRENLQADVGPDDSLIEAGVLDSIGLMNLLAFVETHTGVRIPDAEVTPQHFETAAAIETLVTKLRGG